MDRKGEQKLGGVLERVAAEAVERSQRNRAAGLNPTRGDESEPCPTCRGAQVLKARPNGDLAFTHLVRCPDCYVPTSIEDRLSAAGVERPTDFASWRPVPEMTEAVEACLALLRGERWCVFLRGGPGRGKTHLAKATVRARLEAGGTALFRKVPRLLDDLRDTYNHVNRTHDEEEQARSWHSLSGQLEIMRSTGLLVLDDFGAQKPTEWASEKLYTVIDDRYEARAPLIVTTNVLPREEAARWLSRSDMERTLDRLSPGVVLIDKGESRRQEFDL